ncbi:hypothetical protein, conserved [Eimeria tenella]|uniref:RNase NYN domain-containing protein n=1 Tax=Eimeria tenella TaxID=5802 RepID=U6L300_EIMTE|nr:hypothetical protein, conserved [Eimeria tenella]CDJ44536.1 hypothetical protein, conserved [Eimeria tenella]|eukprot:XP_013235284.1 hypothetical protein, conserved [Eimeria tenella]
MLQHEQQGLGLRESVTVLHLPLLQQLQQRGLLVVSPEGFPQPRARLPRAPHCSSSSSSSSRAPQRRSTYDDLLLLQLALRRDAFIVSNDRMQDLQQLHPHYSQLIKERRLSYAFSGSGADPGSWSVLPLPADLTAADISSSKCSSKCSSSSSKVNCELAIWLRIARAIFRRVE